MPFCAKLRDVIRLAGLTNGMVFFIFFGATLFSYVFRALGCGALHILWEDLAEVRTMAVIEKYRGTGIGSQLLEQITKRAIELGVKRIFCLTFETDFFSRHGFVEIQGTPVDPAVYQELLLSYDAGIAEFLELESVKPNTLGNTRMLRVL